MKITNLDVAPWLPTFILATNPVTYYVDFIDTFGSIILE